MAHRQLGRVVGNQPCVEASKHSSDTARGKSLRQSPAFVRLPALIATLLLPISAGTIHARPQHVPGQIIIKAKAQSTSAPVVEKLRRRGASIRSLEKSRVQVVRLDEESVDELLNELRQDPSIEFAERDYVARTTYVPNDPLVLGGSAWHLSKVEAPLAWDLARGRSNIVIAVLDSGVMANHADLSGQILPGYDFVNGDSDPADDFGHGTAVAGTVVAAGNNSFGAAGVAFGCRVLPVKVVDASGFGSYSTIAQGIRYAVDQGARVINLSIAGTAASAALQDAVNYAWGSNVIVVASAGNDGNSIPQYPAACQNVIAVSALTSMDSLAGFSSFGSHIRLSAPGENIWTTQRTASSPFGAWRGTSFASPIVAGAAGLVAAANPSLSNQRIGLILAESADDLGAAGNDEQFGAGRVNLYKAIFVASREPGAIPWTEEPEPTNQPPADSDQVAPVVSITMAPRSNSRLASPVASLSGTATDNMGVREVVVTVNGTSQVASGTTDWSAQVNLAAGLNRIQVQSVDASGNRSPAVSFTCTYVVLQPVSILTNGIGAVSPNLNGKLLEIGRTYTVRAVPGQGQAFAGWNEGSEAQSLTFTMRSNLVLTADFVPSPFPVVRGNYMGLIADTNGVTPSSAGLFNITVSGSGLYTGRLQVGASRYKVSGQLNLRGISTVTLSRKNSPALRLTVQVDLTGQSDQLSGLITDGAWTSEVSGDRNVFNSRSNPAPQAGERSFYLKRTEDAMTAGSGTSAINTSGTIRIKGRLGDGRPFSAGSMLARNGDSALYVPLSNGSETVIGWLNFPAQSNTAANGSVAWVRVGTNAFAAMLEATSASSAD